MPVGGAQTDITATFQDTGCGGSGSTLYRARTANSGTTYLDNTYNCGTAPQRPFPNPADKVVFLPNLQGSITIYNSQGQPVARHAAATNGPETLMDIQSLPNGFYAVTGQNLDGQPQRYLIQIQH